MLRKHDCCQKRGKRSSSRTAATGAHLYAWTLGNALRSSQRSSAKKKGSKGIKLLFFSQIQRRLQQRRRIMFYLLCLAFAFVYFFFFSKWAAALVLFYWRDGECGADMGWALFFLFNFVFFLHQLSLTSIVLVRSKNKKRQPDFRVINSWLFCSFFPMFCFSDFSFLFYVACMCAHALFFFFVCVLFAVYFPTWQDLHTLFSWRWQLPCLYWIVMLCTSMLSISLLLCPFFDFITHLPPLCFLTFCVAPSSMSALWIDIGRRTNRISLSFPWGAHA